MLTLLGREHPRNYATTGSPMRQRGGSCSHRATPTLTHGAGCAVRRARSKRDGCIGWRSVALTFLAIIAIAFAQRPTTVAELVSFIKDSITRKQDDRLVADYLLKRMRMKEHLDDKTVEELHGLGAGPRVTAALRKLSEESANLATAPPPVMFQAAPPPPPGPPPPSSEEQAQILDEIRANAINYSNNLPNFICTQVTRRTADPSGTGNHWRQLDTIQEQLTFFDHREKYVVTMVNGAMVTNRDHEKLGGATSRVRQHAVRHFQSDDRSPVRMGALDDVAWAADLRVIL